MRALDHLLGLAAVAVLTCGLSGSLGGERAFAESQRVAASGSARRIVAVYRVEIAGFNLGNFRLTANFRGSNYEMRGEAHFSILDGLIYEWQGTTLSKGKVTRSGPKPAMYALSYRGGKKVEQLRMTFGDGAVTKVRIVPKRRPSPHTIPVTKEQLEGVFDPMTGAFLYARSNNPNGDLNVCRQNVPVFDGKQRFDLVLTPKKLVRVKANGKSSYSGPAVVCKVKFIPIAGYRPDNPGIRLMSKSDDIEVWLVPLRGTGMYVPYRIAVPTPIGIGSALATSFQVTGAKRASIEP